LHVLGITPVSRNTPTGRPGAGAIMPVAAQAPCGALSQRFVMSSEIKVAVILAGVVIIGGLVILLVT
jgi:hypothetical protein